MLDLKNYDQEYFMKILWVNSSIEDENLCATELSETMNANVSYNKRFSTKQFSQQIYKQMVNVFLRKVL